MSSERVIEEGTSQEYMVHHADVETRMPIPNEREMTRTSNSIPPTAPGTRTIKYQGDGSTTLTPSQLPFNPPGLKWNGQPAITTSTLVGYTRRTKKTAGRGRLIP